MNYDCIILDLTLIFIVDNALNMSNVTIHYLRRLLISINKSVKSLSKQNNYHPPEINLDKNQSVESLKLQFDKINIFLDKPYYGYLTRSIKRKS